jgi:hypothetical protein
MAIMAYFFENNRPTAIVIDQKPLTGRESLFVRYLLKLNIMIAI